MKSNMIENVFTTYPKRFQYESKQKQQIKRKKKHIVFFFDSSYVQLTFLFESCRACNDTIDLLNVFVMVEHQIKYKHIQINKES